jgi:hypothetical protein
LIIIDKNSALGEASIRKRGVGGKNKIPQNIGSFLGNRLDIKKNPLGRKIQARVSSSGPEKIGISVLPARNAL